MAASSKPAPRSAQSGIAFNVLVPGAFYQGIMPGGFSDSKTGIHVPGPKAIVDGTVRRATIGLTELPDPIQLPHTKIIIEISESGKTRKEIEVPFNENDEQPVHDAFQLALATEIIRMVPEDEVEEKYPRAWAARVEKLVWRAENVNQAKPYMEMIHDAESANRFVDTAESAKAAKDGIRNRDAGLDKPRVPTPPPPKP